MSEWHVALRSTIKVTITRFNYVDSEADLLELRQLEAGERYNRSHHGPFGCTPRPSSEVSRTSLLGRPIKPGTRHRDARYRKLQNKVYNFLERPRGCQAVSYHVLMWDDQPLHPHLLISSFPFTRFFMVFACLVVSVFSTIDEYEKEASDVLYKMVSREMSERLIDTQRDDRQSVNGVLALCCLIVNPLQELIMVFWFAGEFAARIWAVGCRSRYQGWIGRLRFLRSPFCVIG